MTAMSTDETLLFQEIDSIETACDYAEDSFCKKEKAEWIMFRNCPHCHVGGQRLVCTHCKEARLSLDAGVVCNPGCGKVTSPARKYYKRCEPL